jgi:hypothetical protein
MPGCNRVAAEHKALESSPAAFLSRGIITVFLYGRVRPDGSGPICCMPCLRILCDTALAHKNNTEN